MIRVFTKTKREFEKRAAWATRVKCDPFSVLVHVPFPSSSLVGFCVPVYTQSSMCPPPPPKLLAFVGLSHARHEIGLYWGGYARLFMLRPFFEDVNVHVATKRDADVAPARVLYTHASSMRFTFEFFLDVL